MNRLALNRVHSIGGRPLSRAATDVLNPPTKDIRAEAALTPVRRIVTGLLPKLQEGVVGDLSPTMDSHDRQLRLETLVDQYAAEESLLITDLQRKRAVSQLVAGLEGRVATDEEDNDDVERSDSSAQQAETSNRIEAAYSVVQPLLMEQIVPTEASRLSREELAGQIGDIVSDLLAAQRQSLNLREQRQLVTKLVNDMIGLGPLEQLLNDETVNDILVNGSKQIFVERAGKLELTDITFRDDRHLMNVATRIVSAIGRRVDETVPLCDARLADGSRVNIIIPPLAIDGPSISIRKFSKKNITIDKMVKQRNVSPKMATVMKIASACRLNILISGGTGSGKTTLLNAMSQMIDHGERIVTIEDAAELQLQQPHVVRLETRTANLEGQGEISMRDLVKNSLRMRPDRIILGEIRGAEAIDMLQAMNTGHDGSMCTVHANTPRDALMRLENMVGMSGIKLPSKAIRTQIASAVQLIVQIARMRDGIRRIVQISEIVGMEGDVITMQDLYVYKYEGEDENGHLVGEWESAGVRPHFMPRAEYFGLGRALASSI